MMYSINLEETRLKYGTKRETCWVFFSVLILVVAVLVMDISLSHPVVQTQSCSNYPTLAPGNIIFVEDTDFENIKEGDTVVYKAPSEGFTVLHQVINKSEDSLQTKGENNGQRLPFEKNVEPSQIWGTSAFIIPLNIGPKCRAR